MTGNVCKMLFSKPKALAKMLNIPVEYVLHFVAILAVLDSKKALPNPDAFEAFCNDHLNQKFRDERYKWNHHNVIIVSLYLVFMLKFFIALFVTFSDHCTCTLFTWGTNHASVTRSNGSS